MTWSETINFIVNIMGILVGVLGLITARVYFRNWFRLHAESCGELLIDTYGTKVVKEDLNNKGYIHYLRVLKKEIDQRVGSKSYDVIASPAEIDYLFPFLLAHMTKKRFCSIHTSPEWPSYLHRFRYNTIRPGDRVLFVSIVLSSGKFLMPAMDMVLQESATVCGVFVVVEALPGPEERGIVEDDIRRKNVPFYAIHQSLQPL